VRNGKTESLVLADEREEARAGRERSSERRRQWRAAVRLLLRASEREGESASRGVPLAAGTEADTAGRTWWPTRARPSHRKRATRRPSSAGSPRRHGAAVRARGRGAGASAGKGEAQAWGGRAGFAGWAGWLALARQ